MAGTVAGAGSSRGSLCAALAVALAAACGGGSSADPPLPVAAGGMDAGSDAYDEARAIESCQNACAPYGQACGGDCDDGCDDPARLTSAENCPREFYAYHDCLAAAAPDDVDCQAGDAMNNSPVAGCADSWLAYSQCRRTRGFDCVRLASNAAVCQGAETPGGTPAPDWATCKIDVRPPDDCVPLDATDFCCAAD